ncbi:hypothetical protein BSY18_4109 (plasmid) [Blastomonas sp. RAC04]|uniref:hypothetical protein n=1 Tax=Blastomonas sp. RAC04 TaxID=1842535 RepID=UPI00083D5034|nr:hypothetical protein [Blastomonas sp. RAC04]AOF98828.1 hypothetical protein BSY18_4109 [Blastomonas sp. RAC04]
MSTVHVVLDRRSASAELANAQPHAAQTLISSNSASVASTIAVPSGSGSQAEWSWEVTALEADTWVAFGAAPVAASGSGHLVKSGETKRFQASTAGEKIAARDVA